MHWILKTRQEAMALPGVKRVDMSNLSDPRMEQIAAMRRQVESIGIQFPMGSDTPTAADVPRLSQAMDALVALEKLAAEMGVAVSLTIYGHADATGHEKRNYEISQARAKTVAAMLYARGSSMPVAIYGLGADYANKEGNGRAADSSSRRIEMRVRLTQAGDATPEVLRQDE
jgi:OOP family OmpA-OmpF porin